MNWITQTNWRVVSIHSGCWKHADYNYFKKHQSEVQRLYPTVSRCISLQNLGITFSQFVFCEQCRASGKVRGCDPTLLTRNHTISHYSVFSSLFQIFLCFVVVAGKSHKLQKKHLKTVKNWWTLQDDKIIIHWTTDIYYHCYLPNQEEWVKIIQEL